MNLRFHIWTMKYKPMIGIIDSFEPSEDLMIWKIIRTMNYWNLLELMITCDLNEWNMNNWIWNVKYYDWNLVNHEAFFHMSWDSLLTIDILWYVSIVYWTSKWTYFGLIWIIKPSLGLIELLNLWTEFNDLNLGSKMRKELNLGSLGLNKGGT